VLINAVKDMTVRTHEGDIKIASGSLVYVIETGNDVAVFDFCDNGVGKVNVQSGGKIFI